MSLSTLCQRCGLCCDGSLFTHVPLRGAEPDRARRLGLPVVARADGSPALRQGCAALDGLRCTVYAERPESCRKYHCLLYAALAEGEVELDEALEVVDEARGHIQHLEAALPPAEEANPASALERARRDAASGALPAPASDALKRAETFLDLHFRGR